MLILPERLRGQVNTSMVFIPEIINRLYRAALIPFSLYLIYLKKKIILNHKSQFYPEKSHLEYFSKTTPVSAFPVRATCERLFSIQYNFGNTLEYCSIITE